MQGTITEVRKADRSLQPFDERKIADSIFKAMQAVGREDRFLAEELSSVVTLFLQKNYDTSKPVGIEDMQDMVEKVLIETGYARSAKAYILYREKRVRVREALGMRPSPLYNSQDFGYQTRKYGISGEVEIHSGVSLDVLVKEDEPESGRYEATIPKLDINMPLAVFNAKDRDISNWCQLALAHLVFQNILDRRFPEHKSPLQYSITDISYTLPREGIETEGTLKFTGRVYLFMPGS